MPLSSFFRFRFKYHRQHGAETPKVFPYPLCHFSQKRFKGTTANLNDMFSKLWEVREKAENPEN